VTQDECFTRIPPETESIPELITDTMFIDELIREITTGMLAEFHLTELQPKEVSEVQLEQAPTDGKPEQPPAEMQPKEMATEGVNNKEKSGLPQVPPEDVFTDGKTEQAPTEMQPKDMPAQRDLQEVQPGEARELLFEKLHPKGKYEETERKVVDSAGSFEKLNNMSSSKDNSTDIDFADDEATDSDLELRKVRPKVYRPLTVRDAERGLLAKPQETSSSTDVPEIPTCIDSIRTSEVDSDGIYTTATVLSSEQHGIETDLREEGCTGLVSSELQSEESSGHTLEEGTKSQPEKVADAKGTEVTETPWKGVASPPEGRSPSPSYFCSRCQISMSKTRGVLVKGTFTCDECLAMGTQEHVPRQSFPEHPTTVETTCTPNDQNASANASLTRQRRTSLADLSDEERKSGSMFLFTGVDY